jgi:choline-sulfatase
VGAGALASRLALGAEQPRRSPPSREGKPPNFVFIISDQLGLDAIAAHGCPDVRTPNLDRLVGRGVSFMESHSTDPVCSPARSSLMTGHMPTETGVISNGRPIHSSVPHMGQWLGERGYETVYCGKWHLPDGYQAEIDGFTVLPAGGGQGDLVDPVVSRSSEAYLKGRSRDRPFLLVASFLQPHDICYWAIRGKTLVPEELPFPAIAGQLPELPPNHTAQPPAPERLARAVYKGFSPEQWRYYIWIYYRQVEMLDADVGRVLDALEDSGEADNTIVILTADHGEGRGRHQHVQK